MANNKNNVKHEGSVVHSFSPALVLCYGWLAHFALSRWFYTLSAGLSKRGRLIHQPTDETRGMGWNKFHDDKAAFPHRRLNLPIHCPV
jgi:hypothetical protein